MQYGYNPDRDRDEKGLLLQLAVEKKRVQHKTKTYTLLNCCLKKNLNASRPSEHPPVNNVENV